MIDSADEPLAPDAEISDATARATGRTAMLLRTERFCELPLPLPLPFVSTHVNEPDVHEPRAAVVRVIFTV
jgi:hypothetical protein